MPLAIAAVVRASLSNHCGRSTFSKTSYSAPAQAPSPARIAAKISVQTPVAKPLRAPSYRAIRPAAQPPIR